jgi:hypothetical protein
MARQDVVRALIPRQDLDRVRGELHDELGIPTEQVEFEEAEPGLYRDEQPALELRRLVRIGRIRVAVAAVLGAALGVIVAAVVPVLRDVLPISAVLLGFGGAWGAGVAVAARSVQKHPDEGARPDKLREVSTDHASEYAVMTVRDLTNRTAVVDHLMDHGVALLDSRHPRVGRDEPGARPVDGNDRATGPPEP